MKNTMTDTWTAELSCLGMPAHAYAISPMVKERPTADAFGADEGTNVGISAWRPPVC